MSGTVPSYATSVAISGVPKAGCARERVFWLHEKEGGWDELVGERESVMHHLERVPYHPSRGTKLLARFEK